MVKAVIFDMDGVLIDSEPLWKKSLIKVFAPLGIELTVELCNHTMGFRSVEVIEYWYQKKPWYNKTKEEVLKELLNTVIIEIEMSGKILEGVLDTLNFLNKEAIPMALASSSPLIVIDKVLDKLKIRDYFKVIESAEHLAYGKPHPAVFLEASQKLEIDPSNCLVIEDSLNGVIAAKAAKMKVIAVPDYSFGKDPKFIIADHVLQSLIEFQGVFKAIK